MRASLRWATTEFGVGPPGVSGAQGGRWPSKRTSLCDSPFVT